MQWLILYSHQNDDVCEIPVDQIRQNTKNELFQHKINYIQKLR